MLTPLLSVLDREETSEGALDPLGLYATADELAGRLVPGVRERMTHPRFLTAIAVSAILCERFDPDQVAEDGVSAPWQVFEWYVVESFVRRLDAAGHLRGIPGTLKVRNCVEKGLQVCAKSYLKTASVFGFNGVYRTLAEDLGVVTRDGRIGEFGFELVKTWELEQGLAGFADQDTTDGAWWRGLLIEAVREGLQKGAVARGGGWQGWTFLADHLDPHAFGRRERALVWKRLAATGAGSRPDVLAGLISGEGQAAYLGENGSASEKRFHGWLGGACSPDTTALLATIAAYESFARLLQDAFDEFLHHMTMVRRRVPVGELADLRLPARAAERAPRQYPGLCDRLAPYASVPGIEARFGELGAPMATERWCDALLRHHQRIQSAKPPHGKLPWIERLETGDCLVRTPYLREEPVPAGSDYVHLYRSASLLQFARDMGRIK